MKNLRDHEYQQFDESNSSSFEDEEKNIPKRMGQVAQNSKNNEYEEEPSILLTNNKQKSYSDFYKKSRSDFCIIYITHSQIETYWLTIIYSN